MNMISILVSKTDKIDLCSRSQNNGYLEKTCREAAAKLIMGYLFYLSGVYISMFNLG